MRVLKAAVPPAATVIVVVFAWWLIVTVFAIEPYVLPGPGSVGTEFLTSSGLLIENAGVTIYEAIVAFGVSVVLGLAIALLFTLVPVSEMLVYPLVVGTQSVPKLAIAPLFVVWLGFGTAPKILIAVLVAIFPIIINSTAGLRPIPDRELLAASMGLGAWRNLVKLRLPGALPSIFAGMKIAASFSVIGAVVGEFVGADRGLGKLALTAGSLQETSLVIAVLITLGVIGILAYLVIELTERLVVNWKPAEQSEAA